MRLTWLPVRDDWDEQLRAAKAAAPAEAVALLRELALTQMEFPQLGKLDRVLGKVLAEGGASGLAQGAASGLEPVRLAVLGSATTNHLLAAIRVGGLRRGLAIEIYEAPYGMYQQELLDPQSGLARFGPEVVLLALDARHVVGAARNLDPAARHVVGAAQHLDPAAGHVVGAAQHLDPAARQVMGAAEDAKAALALLRSCWRQARASFGCQVVQQTLLPVLAPILGDNEERLAGSPARLLESINQGMRGSAAAEGVDLLAVDRLAAVEGLREWHDPGMWHRAKYEVHPRAAEMYGDHVARLVAAARGRSAKCLVLDLDNTLWGGVIGDDGLNGIELGQGSAAGEAYVELQRYAKALSSRGVVLAVCSKNDEANAREPFEQHPEMVLRSEDIACFVANWEDKATNLRRIAAELKLGLDALVFVDDNPVERALVRRELPMVMVPEMGADPVEYVGVLAAAGYFEGLRVTVEDRERAAMYQANAERAKLEADAATDMEGYLASLAMTLTAGPIDAMGLTRAAQLINKTNQFHLTTKRMSEAEVEAAMRDPDVVTLQARLADRFGDNGMIAVLMARVRGAEAEIEQWLMSCRVLGRRVEEACLNLLVEQLRGRGVERLVGVYRPSAKNAMVAGLYARLGFAAAGELEGGGTRWVLAGYEEREAPMRIVGAGCVGDGSVGTGSVEAGSGVTVPAGRLG